MGSLGCALLTNCIGNHMFQPVKASVPILYNPPARVATLGENVATVAFNKDGKLFDICDPQRKFPFQIHSLNCPSMLPVVKVILNSLWF